MESLTELSIQKIWCMALDWKIKVNEYEETLRVIPYFEKLPYDLKEKILKYIEVAGIPIGDYWYDPEARHIALFLYEGIESLNINFLIEDDDKNFNLTFLFQIGAEKLKNLKRLDLPCKFLLNAAASRQLCNTVPNLQVLKFAYSSSIEDEAYNNMANLPLIEVRFPYLTKENVAHLCKENSVVKETLRIFNSRGLSDEDFCRILKTMTNIERVGNPRKLNSVLKALGPIELNLKKLRFEFEEDGFNIEEELDVATKVCPKITDISIFSTLFTPRIIWLLTQFKSLSSLFIHVQLDYYEEENLDELPVGDEKLTFDQMSSKHIFCFPALVEFTLWDENDTWMSPGYFFTLLEMFPNLEKLQLRLCPGFTNKVAKDLTEFMWNRKLKQLIVFNCFSLYTIGIQQLMKIPSLEKMHVDLYIGHFNRSQLDALQDPAFGTGVRANVRINLMTLNTNLFEWEVVNTVVFPANTNGQ